MVQPQETTLDRIKSLRDIIDFNDLLEHWSVAMSPLVPDCLSMVIDSLVLTRNELDEEIKPHRVNPGVGEARVLDKTGFIKASKWTGAKRNLEQKTDVGYSTISDSLGNSKMIKIREKRKVHISFKVLV